MHLKHVHVLKSLSTPSRRYVGITSDLDRRLAEHNSGKSTHTNKYKPWQCLVAIRFANDQKAKAFERYLKSGSGRAFAKKHF